LNLARNAPPTPIGVAAAENLRYIRNTIEAAHTFTTVPGKGCIAMGLVAMAAAALESIPTLQPYWLWIWLAAAGVACFTALVFMGVKARAQGISLRRTVARRFFLTLAPAFLAGCVLTLTLTPVVSRDVVAGIWLLLYGVGMAACGVFSLPVVLVAGFVFMGLGTVTLLVPPGFAPALLSLGFGAVHFALGAIIWRNHGG
jgi:hypothetical protein